jgi:hypothetical protein
MNNNQPQHKKPHILASLSAKEMNRREFLKFSAIIAASLFGIAGVIKELQSHAATATASLEAEGGVLAGGATVLAGEGASNGRAVKFDKATTPPPPPTNLPTTGDLYKRCAFGVSAGSTGAHAALENLFGAKLKHFVCFKNMGNNGASNWPAEADWCKSTGHTLDIAWDMVGTNVRFSDLIAGKNNASLDAFFQAAKRHGDKVVLRMWWEMNDPHGPTKVGSGGESLVSSSAEWVQAWKYVYNRCKVTNDCTNVKFFWCPNGSDTGNGPLESFYPGDNYVDIIGFDTYNQPMWAGGAWHSFDDQFTGIYNRVDALSGNKNIPMMVGETGTVSGPVGGHTRAEWLRQMFTSQKFPRLRQIDYFNYDLGGGLDWRWDNGADSISVCKQYLPDAVQDTGV